MRYLADYNGATRKMLDNFRFTSWKIKKDKSYSIYLFVDAIVNVHFAHLILKYFIDCDVLDLAFTHLCV